MDTLVTIGLCLLKFMNKKMEKIGKKSIYGWTLFYIALVAHVKNAAKIDKGEKNYIPVFQKRKTNTNFFL